MLKGAASEKNSERACFQKKKKTEVDSFLLSSVVVVVVVGVVAVAVVVPERRCSGPWTSKKSCLRGVGVGVRVALNYMYHPGFNVILWKVIDILLL